ncbi:Required for respiratory growth protein 9 [Escovopsis weberi]|uniref:Required for respiratory growth protein 9, mitochondrial n=1 Tax=Escovopsis weberi TaxID=150374 RepID=A0A0M9VX03_ESCWE|nr:Required for respiratory growth protein 9 [Escovopsis weberi]
MSCSCRVVPWRTFVRGLAQVHRLDALKPAPLALTSRGNGGGLPWAALRQARALHASQGRGQEAAAPPQQISENHDGGENGAELPLPDADIAATPDKQGRIVEAKEGKEGEEREVRKERNERTENTGAAARQCRRERTWAPKGRPHSKTAAAEWTKPRHQPYNPGANSNARGRKSAPDAETARQQQEQQQEQQQQQQKKPAEMWRIQKAALKEKFPEGWKPRKRLSPDALAGIRALNAQFPEAYTTEALAEKFRVPVEAIRRILKSKWTPTVEEEQDREDRWFRRGKQVWEHKAALGVKPPKRWRMEGVARDPGYHEWSKKASRREREWEEEEIRKYRDQIEQRKRGDGGEGRDRKGPWRA